MGGDQYTRRGVVDILVMTPSSFYNGRRLTLMDSIRSCVHSTPRNQVNITHAGFRVFETMMLFFGFIWGSVNLGAAWMYYAWLFGSRGASPRIPRLVPPFLKLALNVFVVLPMWIILFVMPFFGSLLLTPIVQRVRPHI